MKSTRTFAVLALALLASCIGLGVANAQEAVGRFTLPVTAHWGQATLPAGDYSFTLDGAQANGSLYVRGQKAAIVRPNGYNPKTIGQSTLLLTTKNGVATVSELRLADLDVVLYFAPSHPKHMTAAREKEIASTIPVSSGAAR